jgi:hypothetical protein
MLLFKYYKTPVTLEPQGFRYGAPARSRIRNLLIRGAKILSKNIVPKMRKRLIYQRYSLLN